MPNQNTVETLVGNQLALTVTGVNGQIISERGDQTVEALVSTQQGNQLALKVVDVDGGGQPLFNKIIIKDSVIPAATVENVGAVYMYVGESNENFVHGFIYENRYVPNYSGTITFSPAGISVSDTDFSSFLNTWKQYIVNPTAVTNGTITYYAAGDLWRMVMKDENDELVDTLQLYQQDYEDSGFTFPDNPQDGDSYTFTTTITESSASYQWVRTDVQPGGGTVKFVPELPAQGEERYVYGVVLDETTREGYGIIQLFMWYNDNWYAAGAFDVDIDPSQLVYKDNIPYATATKVGGIKQTFDATTGTWSITTDNI